jgi:hypothetical protein
VTEYFAEAFAVRDGCFRFVSDKAGRPEHCPETPVWVGTFEDKEGQAHTVRSCGGHRGGLVNARCFVQSEPSNRK